MSYSEQAEVFPCAGESLVGVLSVPECPFDTAVVVVVGGPQYRAGSHRQFVLLARGLASAGYAVLRFDYRGMGDSSGQQRSFEHVSDDIAAAIDLVVARIPRIERIVLWGLCDGASAALLYCHETQDPRVTGLCLLNPWVRSELGLARTQVKHYYVQRLMQREFWAKLLRGEVASGAVRGLVRSVRTALMTSPQPNPGPSAYTDRMALAWHQFRGHLLLILSGRDYTAKEFGEHVAMDPSWTNVWKHSRLERHSLPDADHTLSALQDSTQVERLTVKWLEKIIHA